MENKANQTALQQAFSELEKLHPNLFNIYSEDGRNFINHFHKFLEIEKEQIIHAFDHGEDFSSHYFDVNNPSVFCSENYYNETYNK